MSAAENIIPFPITPDHSATVIEHARHYTSKLGWQLCILPFKEKGPTYCGWNTIEKAIYHADQLPPDVGGVGLLHGFSGTVEIDFDCLSESRGWLAEQGVDVDQLLNARDAVTLSSGRPDRAKLLYTCPTNFKPITRKVVKEKNKVRTVLFEMRGVSVDGATMQCVLPPSIHPDTGLPYTWGGNGLPDALPSLPDPLLKVWKGLIAEMEDKAIRKLKVEDEHPANVAEVVSAVNAIDPACDYGTWVSVGMALKLKLEQQGGYDIWNNWSMRSEKKYPSVREMEKQWASFRDDKETVVSVGTIFFHAKLAGWERPPVDVSKLFGRVAPERPEVVLSKLFPTTPPLDLSNIPDEIANYAAEISKDTGCDIVVPVLAGIAAASGAADARIRIKVSETYKTSPVVRCMTVGDPADKKTPGSLPMFGVLHQLEQEDKDRYEADMLGWVGQEARHAAQMKAYKEWYASEEAQLPNAVPPNVDPLPTMPQQLRIIINDCTSQKAATLNAGNQRGLLLYADEAATWLQRYVSESSGDNRSFWTASYEAQYYPLDRQGGGTLPVPCAAVSVYGNIQPDILADSLPKLTKDGGHGRFIYGILDTEKTSTGNLRGTPDFLSFRHQYEAAIRRVFLVPGESVFQLSPEAFDLFEEVSESMTESGKAYKRYSISKFAQTLVSKAPGLILRLALLFHMLSTRADAAGNLPTIVSGETMSKAIGFVCTFTLPNAHLADQSAVSQDIRHWLVWRIVEISDRQETVSLSDLDQAFRKTKTGELMTNREERLGRLVSAVSDLEEVLWVMRAAREKFGKSPRWVINPTIGPTFEKEREARRREREKWFA